MSCKLFAMNSAPGIYGFNWLFKNNCDRIIGSPIIAINTDVLPATSTAPNAPVAGTSAPVYFNMDGYIIGRDTFLSQPSSQVLSAAYSNMNLMSLGHPPRGNTAAYKLITQFKDGVPELELSTTHKDRLQSLIDRINRFKTQKLIDAPRDFKITARVSKGRLQYSLAGEKLTSDAVALDRRLDALIDAIPLRNLFFNINHHARFFIHGQKTRSLNSVILNSVAADSHITYPAVLDRDSVVSRWSGDIVVQDIPQTQPGLEEWVNELLAGVQGTTFNKPTMKQALLKAVEANPDPDPLPTSARFQLNITNYQRKNNAPNLCWMPPRREESGGGAGASADTDMDDVDTLAGEMDTGLKSENVWRIALGRVNKQERPDKGKIRCLINIIVVLKLFDLDIPRRKSRGRELIISRAKRSDAVSQRRTEKGRQEVVVVKELTAQKQAVAVLQLHAKPSRAMQTAEFLDLYRLYQNVHDGYTNPDIVIYTNADAQDLVNKALRKDIAPTQRKRVIAYLMIADPKCVDQRKKLFGVLMKSLVTILTRKATTVAQKSIVQGLK